MANHTKLYHMHRKYGLYPYFPDWEILHTRVQNLTWSHIRTVLGEKTEAGRNWYLKEAAEQMWSVKTLERNVGSQYYHRLLASPQKEEVVSESFATHQYPSLLLPSPNNPHGHNHENIVE